MNRIILAYCHDNAELAQTTEQQLSRIGIPFDHVTDLSEEAGETLAARLTGSNDPVILIVTDNFFRSRDCMTGALTALQRLQRDKRLLAVVAPGKISHDGGATFEYVETHFDRMVHALQYMNHWQNAWLELSDRRQHADDAQKNALDTELNITRNIANEMGELISTLRETGYASWEEFIADDYALFFKQFGLQEWHEQYRRLAAAYVPEPIPPLPQTAPKTVLAETTIPSGILVPEPALTTQEDNDAWNETDEKPAAKQNSYTLHENGNPETAHMPEDTGGDILPETAAKEDVEGLPQEEPDADFETTEPAGSDIPYLNIDTLLQDMEKDDERPVEKTPEADMAAAGDPAILTTELREQAEETDIEQAIHDAWIWIEKGHIDRGVELLQFAAEQYPDNERARNELAKAQARFAPLQDNPLPVEETVVPAPDNQDDKASEARSYDIMGDLAAEKGDYLFAKYCWDRAAELDPDYPGIFRKLGLMTSEHLRDYRETAVHYLRKALEHEPDNAEIHFALAGSVLQNDDSAQAENHYIRAIQLNPALRTAENDRLYHTGASPALEEPEPEKTAPASVPAEQTQVLPEKREVLTVLITGATSGIGHATAEIFARHGHRVILTGRRIERLVLLKTQFETDMHSDVMMLPFDIREQGAVQAALDNLPDAWQNIDILVNNAGLAKGLAPVQEGNLEHWEQMIDTNLKGLLYVTRAVTPGMVRRRRGHIINLGSSAGKEVYANGNVYCATKFAVDALTRAMRLDLHTHNIRVSQVSPGHVEETEFALTRFDGDAERARIYNDFQPLKASDVAEAIYFIATRPPHVNIQDIWMYGTQQASATVIDRSGRGEK
jgi:NADP-dependent 3-hydroxy acid dehydrogenase YdfG